MVAKKLEKQVKFMKENHDYCGVTCFGNVILENKNKKINISYFKSRKDNGICDLLLGKFSPVSDGLLLKRSIFDKESFYDEFLKLSADFDMMIRIFKAGFRIGIIEEILYNYYVHSQNLTGTTFQAKIKSLNQRIIEAEYLLQKHHEIYENCKRGRALMLRHISSFYKLSGNNKKAFAYLINSLKTNFNPRAIINLITILLPIPVFSFLFNIKVNSQIYLAKLRYFFNRIT